MPDKRAGVCVVFDAVALHHDYAVKGRFAEVVPAIGGDRHRPSLEQEIVRRHHATLASERRFWQR